LRGNVDRKTNGTVHTLVQNAGSSFPASENRNEKTQPAFPSLIACDCDSQSSQAQGLRAALVRFDMSPLGG
jgi:hypothetical protein